MAMQTLQQELEPLRHGLTATDHPVLRGLSASPTIAYAEEVLVLRQGVALLEAELAATKAAASAPGQTPLERSMGTRSEFVEQLVPAVSAASSLAASPRRQQTGPQQTAPPVPTPNASLDASEARPGFAHARSTEDEAASFEERVAERAFLHASTVDAESRSWLLAE
jgi:hypothetical protein